MQSRRSFLKTTASGIGAMSLPLSFSYGNILQETFPSNRPAESKRNFVSQEVEKTIREMKKKIADPELAWLFENCFPNTLDTTVQYSLESGQPDTFVITGDIDAMWLRDSTAQVWPYLPLMKNDKELQNLVKGLIFRQSRCILHDPYANAFYKDGTELGEWKDDITEMKPGIHERKWEIDSLCYTIRLAYGYWKETGDTSVFNNLWQKSVDLIYQTFIEQQRKTNDGPYKFMRITEKPTDSMPGFGLGNPIRPTGLIASAFRPSDDATVFMFLIPSNYFAVVSLQQLAEIYQTVLKKPEESKKFNALADEVKTALQEHAIVEHPRYGKILALEVDGFGNRLLMDDANIPSLLSLPYLGCLDTKDTLYQSTRKFVWSEDNPYFSKGKAAEGIGGPHVGKDFIWPMSIIMHAMTSTDKKEIVHALKTLTSTHAGTGFMHESFYKDNAAKFTRHWFAWVNTLFGELILKISREYPDILQIKDIGKA